MISADLCSQKVNERIESGELTLRDAYAEQMDSIDLPLEECQRILKERWSIFYSVCICADEFRCKD